MSNRCRPVRGLTTGRASRACPSLPIRTSPKRSCSRANKAGHRGGMEVSRRPDTPDRLMLRLCCAWGSEAQHRKFLLEFGLRQNVARCACFASKGRPGAGENSPAACRSTARGLRRVVAGTAEETCRQFSPGSRVCCRPEAQRATFCRKSINSKKLCCCACAQEAQHTR